MGYDFFADFALEEDEVQIDQVVNHQGKYALLKNADWTTKAQVLATGVRFETEIFPKTKPNSQQASLKELIKDGRVEKKRRNAPVEIEKIGGYPELVSRCPAFPPATPLNIAQLCAPDPATCLDGLPDGSCLVQVEVTLERPFTSRDDRAFYPHENPLKREWVFQAPYLAAAGIKGLLRWAWRMRFGEEESVLEKSIFGPRNEGLRDGDGQAGCLYTWPLFWHGKVGLEVINPHSRQTGAGNKPIKYEVVQKRASATLWLLLMNRQIADARKFATGTVRPLLEALTLLLSDSGISAKRSADWGSVSVQSAKATLRGIAPDAPTPAGKAATIPVEVIDPWLKVMDGQGNLLLPEEHVEIFTAKRLVLLTGKSEKMVWGRHRDEALASVKTKFAEYRAAQEALAMELEEPPPQAQPSPSLAKEFRNGAGVEDLAKWLGALAGQEGGK